jgi:hypothetical protein
MIREASEAVRLQRATPDMAPVLGNLLELYVHDLSEVFPIELGPEGRFGYDKLPLYWVFRFASTAWRTAG